MSSIIEIRNLGKQYKLVAAEPYVALRDVVANSIRRIFSPKQKHDSLFWALKGINLDIQPGDRVGIIGRNGAGKSTLLKIISRITPPTTGSAIIDGRVASLLEVGTGFHSELTGRENIYLNGSILGLKKKEIDQRLDAIIDFSGVEKFIDTAIKYYSSGMQLRLAFSVAAHLEPEILLIDEVLAVGDIEFQKKCMGKMEEVSRKDGRTILFVSHNIDAVSRLCNVGILLKSGKVELHDDIDKVVSKYLADHDNNEMNEYTGSNDITKEICIIKGRIVGSDDVPTQAIKNGQSLNVRLRIAVNKTKKFSFELLIRDSSGSPLLFLPTGIAHGQEHTLAEGEYDISITTELPFLTKDRYTIDLIIADTNKGYIHYLESPLSFNMEGSYFEKTGFTYQAGQKMGKILLTQKTTIDIK